MWWNEEFDGMVCALSPSTSFQLFISLGREKRAGVSWGAYRGNAIALGCRWSFHSFTAFSSFHFSLKKWREESRSPEWMNDCAPFLLLSASFILFHCFCLCFLLLAEPLAVPPPITHQSKKRQSNETKLNSAALPFNSIKSTFFNWLIWLDCWKRSWAGCCGNALQSTINSQFLFSFSKRKRNGVDLIEWAPLFVNSFFNNQKS